MINNWSNLNSRGKLLYVACWINLFVATTLAWSGEWMCIFSAVMAMMCSFCTYDPKYQLMLICVVDPDQDNQDDEQQ